MIVPDANSIEQSEQCVHDDQHQDDDHDHVDHGSNWFGKWYDGEDGCHGPVNQAGDDQINDEADERFNHGDIPPLY